MPPPRQMRWDEQNENGIKSVRPSHFPVVDLVHQFRESRIALPFPPPLVATAYFSLAFTVDSQICCQESLHDLGARPDPSVIGHLRPPAVLSHV
jgi:hypothetical protein